MTSYYEAHRNPIWDGKGLTKYEVQAAKYHEMRESEARLKQLAKSEIYSRRQKERGQSKSDQQKKASIQCCSRGVSISRPASVHSGRTSEDDLYPKIAKILNQIKNSQKGILKQINQYKNRYRSYTVDGAKAVVGIDNKRELADHIKGAFLDPIYRTSQNLYYYERANDSRRQHVYKDPIITIPLKKILDEVQSLGVLFKQLLKQRLNKLRSEFIGTGLESSRTIRPGAVSARSTSVSTPRPDSEFELSLLFLSPVMGVSFWDRLSNTLEINDPSSPLVSIARISGRETVTLCRYEQPDVSGVGGGVGRGSAWPAYMTQKSVKSRCPVPALNMKALHRSNLGGSPSRNLTARLVHTQRMRKGRTGLSYSFSTSVLPSNRGGSSGRLQRVKSSTCLSSRCQTLMS